MSGRSWTVSIVVPTTRTDIPDSVVVCIAADVFQSGQISRNVCQKLMNHDNVKTIEMTIWNVCTIGKSLPR